MAFKRPPPPGFEEEWQRLARRSAELRQEFAAFLDDFERLLRKARFASLTHKEAVAEFLRERPGQVFGSREIQKALEAEGLVFSSYYTVSATLTRLQADGRALQVSHGRWTAPRSVRDESGRG